MKITQIIAMSTGALMALSEEGDIHYGWFVEGADEFARPTWNWRKIPGITDGAYQYNLQKESTAVELAQARKQNNKLAKLAKRK